MSTTNPSDPSYVAGGSGWAGQTIDLLALAQQQALAREELAFKKWAAEKGFEVDEKNRAWLKEQFYQSQEFQRQQSLGYMQGTPFGQQTQSRSSGSSGSYYVNADAPELADEMAARRAIWDNKGNVRKLWKGKVAPTDEQVYDLVGNWLKKETKGTDAMSYAIDKGYGRPVGYTTQGAGGAGGVPEDWIKTLEREVSEWNRELSQQGLGLNYLNTLASMRGPRDWVQYANTVRAAEGSQLPAWAQSLVQGQNIPQFQGSQGGFESIWNQPAQSAWAAMGQPGGYGQQGQGYQQPAPSPNQAVMMGAQGAQQMGGYGPNQAIIPGPVQNPQFATGGMPGQQYTEQFSGKGAVPGQLVQAGGQNQPLDTYYGRPVQFQVGGVPGQQYAAPGQQQVPNWMQQLAQNPQSVRYSQWQNMLPFEREMLGGALENEGQDFNTWQEQMSRTWVPRQKVTPITSWQ